MSERQSTAGLTVAIAFGALSADRPLLVTFELSLTARQAI